MRDRLRVGLAGFSEHPWRSVDKTRRFFLNAIEKKFEYEFVDSSDFSGDVLLNFSSSKWWQSRENDFPVIHCIHGGATIDVEFLKKNLTNLYRTDGLIVNCHSDVELLNLYTDESPIVSLLQLPVDHSIFYRRHDYTQIDDIIHPDELVIGFFARLLPQKNLHGFLESFYCLKRQFKKLKAVVVGNYWLDYPLFNWEGTQYPNYIQKLINQYQLVNDLKYFTSTLSSSDLALLMSRCDIIMHPTLSVDENFGYVVPEAMACGTPVIGSAYGGLKDTLAEENVGFAMPTWISDSGLRVDLASGTYACQKYLSDHDIRKNHSQNAMKLSSIHYSLNAFQNKLSAIINETVARHKRSENKDTKVSLGDFLIKNNTDVNYLPDTDGISWNDISNSVYYYTSKSTYNQEKHLVYPSSPFHLNQVSKQLKMNNPMWPATFDVSSEEIKILDTFSNSHFIQPTQFDLNYNTKLNSMIKKGILNFTKK